MSQIVLRKNSSWKNNFSFFLVALFPLIIANCSASSSSIPRNAPAWVFKGHDTALERGRYLSASACSSTPLLADDLARAQLAKQVRVSIVSDNETTQVLTSYDRKETERVDIRDVVRTSSGITLDGVSIKDRFVRRQTFCSLAVLDKQALTEKLKQNIAVSDSKISAVHHSLQLEPDPVSQFQQWKELTRLANHRDNQYSILVAIGGAKPDHASDVTSAVATDSLRHSRKRLKAVIEAVNPETTLLANQVKSALASCGLPIITEGEAPLTIQLVLSYQESNRPPGKYTWLTYDFSAAVINQESGAIVVSMFAGDEVGHTSLANVKRRIVALIKEESLPDFSARTCAWWKELTD